jgi:hypothetical protein
MLTKAFLPLFAASSLSPLNQITAYVSSLFPFLRWITRYNTSWLIGDLIAGITVGMVLVPQSMSYARLASTCSFPRSPSSSHTPPSTLCNRSVCSLRAC